MKDIEKITCSNIFKNYIYKSIPLAFDESMSYYETLCNVLALLKKHEEIINNNADVLKELENYVIHYFDNLDVQEEINNKLDKMAEDGTLENLISQYVLLQTTFVYNNINEMKNATNLTNGSFARTSGFYEYDDGGGAFYKVRNVTNEDIIDNITIIALNDVNLVAELITPEIIKPEIFGAYGDGVHDDTNAIAKMIDYVYIRDPQLWLPSKTMICEKTYNINKIIIPNGMQNFKINGNSKGEFKNGGFEFPSDTGHYTEIKNLTFTSCNNTINFQYYNMEFGKIYVENCNFYSCTGTTLIIKRRSHRVWIKNNTFSNCEKAVYLEDVDMCYFEDNIIETTNEWQDNHYEVEQNTPYEGTIFVKGNLFVPGIENYANNCAWVKIGRNAVIENNRFSGEHQGVYPIYIDQNNFDNFNPDDAYMYPIINFVNNPIVAGNGSILINKMMGQLNILNNSFVKVGPCIKVINETIFNNLDFNKLYISISNNAGKIFNYRNYGWSKTINDNVAPIVPLCLQKFIKKNNLYALNKNLNYETSVNNKTLKIKLNTKSIIDSEDIQFLIYGRINPNPGGSGSYFENFTALLTLKRDYSYDVESINIFPEIKLLTNNPDYRFTLTPLINNVEKIPTQANTLPDDIELSVVYSGEFNNATVFFKGFLPLEFIPIQNDNVFNGNDWATNN